MNHEFIQADCLDWLREQPDDSVSLVLTSPPYERARTYGVGFNLRGQDWVDWCMPRFLECVRVCKGLVAWVVEGQTRQFRYSCAPFLLMADLHRAGVHLRKPVVFHRVGIPGSGGPDWLRNDWEPIVCATSGGKLPWSDNTAMGHPPKWAPGGAMSYRLSDGARVNQWGHGGDGPTAACRNQDGTRSANIRPSQKVSTTRELKTRSTYREGGRAISIGIGDGRQEQQQYIPPTLANPGNTVQQTYTADEVASLFEESNDVLHVTVGGGLMGSEISHENEAPYSEELCEFFIRSFCPKGGTVLDIFAGSGTTMAVAEKTGRNSISVDVRESQIELCHKRLEEAKRISAQKTFLD